ncbi:MAG: putative alpha/beta-fold hydrolase [Gammaproteobacteria bacterium]|jgi:predicted alpha/beta-fold hydrolase
MIKQSTFRPASFLSNRHLQTILPNLIHPKHPKLHRERLELDDDDFIDLDWSQTRSPQTLLILHGLEGSVNSSYAQRMLNYCNHNQIAAVFMHLRGCSGEQNRLLQSYHSGETGDLNQVIEYLKNKGICHIALLGYSLGGNQVMKYMGEAETSSVICCAIGVSVPMTLSICSTTMNRGFAKIYQSTLLGRLVTKLKQKKNLLKCSELSFPDPTKMKNFQQFDDHFTAPIHGFESAHDYYEKSSSRQFLINIDKPTLIIQAKDDPFMATEGLPAANELSTSVTLELSQHGGHVGFISSNFLLPTHWLETCIHSFLNDYFKLQETVN